MPDGIEIRLIVSEDIFSIVPLLRELNAAIPVSILRERLSEMVTQGYTCVGMYLEDELIGICGLWILTKYYVGRHIEPDNIVILPAHRCKGLGHHLMAWVNDYAKSQGCVASELNCYLSNERGQAFWEKEGYRKIAYHFRRDMELKTL